MKEGAARCESNQDVLLIRERIFASRLSTNTFTVFSPPTATTPLTFAGVHR
jgi:hypothetical protein